MKIPDQPFSVIDWAKISETLHPGEYAAAKWRTVERGDLRVRMVEYPAGYVADHWCDRGHIVLVLEGELISELQDGSKTTLVPGMGYHVSDGGDKAHRSRTEMGAKIFIVD